MSLLWNECVVEFCLIFGVFKTTSLRWLHACTKWMWTNKNNTYFQPFYRTLFSIYKYTLSLHSAMFFKQNSIAIDIYIINYSSKNDRCDQAIQHNSMSSRRAIGQPRIVGRRPRFVVQSYTSPGSSDMLKWRPHHSWHKPHKKY